MTSARRPIPGAPLKPPGRTRPWKPDSLFWWLVGDGGVDFRAPKRSNATDASVTDPEARLCKMSPGAGASLCFIGHTPMENRNGLIGQAEVTLADGQDERRAALAMNHRHSRGSTRRLTLGADKGHDCADFVQDLRQACVTPHRAQKARYSAIEGRTTRHPGCASSQKCRKEIEEPFGGAKTVGPMARTMLGGIERVGAQFTLPMAACNLARLPRLPANRGCEEKPGSGRRATCRRNSGRRSGGAVCAIGRSSGGTRFALQASTDTGFGIRRSASGACRSARRFRPGCNGSIAR